MCPVGSLSHSPESVLYIMFRQPLGVRPIPHPLDQRRIGILPVFRRCPERRGGRVGFDLPMHDLQQPRRMRSPRPIVQAQRFSEIGPSEGDFVGCCCCCCGRKRREDVSDGQRQGIRVVQRQRASSRERSAVGMRGVADEGDARRKDPGREGIAGEVGVQPGLRSEVRQGFDDGIPVLFSQILASVHTGGVDFALVCI